MTTAAEILSRIMSREGTEAWQILFLRLTLRRLVLLVRLSDLKSRQAAWSRAAFNVMPLYPVRWGRWRLDADDNDD